MGTVKMKASLTCFTLLITLLGLAEGEMNRTDAAKLGCFKEDKRLRNFRHSPGGYKPDSVTPNDCADACGNYDYKFAGLTQGKYCFCAHSFTISGADGSCNMNCTNGLECGGDGYVTIYEVGGTISNLRVNVSDAIVQVGQPVNFAVSITTTLTVNYQFDYDDGAGLTPKNEAGMLSKSFGMPGEYDVVVKASDVNSSREATATVAVWAHDPVGSIEIFCPEAAVTFNEVECNATIKAGTSMVATVNFGEGSPETFSIADVAKHVTGPAIPLTGSVLPPAAGTIFVLPATEFHHEGILTAFEFYASNSGSITFLVLKPSCPTCYKYQDNLCDVTCLAPDLYQCTASGTDTFCPGGVICKDSCPAPNRYSSSPTSVLSYEIVKAIPYNIGPTGYNYIASPVDMVEVAISKGYILGIVGTNLLATIVADPAELTDFSYTGPSGTAEGETYSNADFTAASARHLLRGITVQPQLVRLRHSYASNGLMSVTLNVSNKYISESQVANTTLSIGEGIDYVILNTSECFSTDQLVTVNILPHIGDDVSYTWDWGDGNAIEQSTVLSKTHTYAGPNIYNVTVTATNLLASKSNFTQVCVQDKIETLQIFCIPSASGSAAAIWLNMTSGSDYTCDWVTDGTTNETTSIDTPSNSAFYHVYSSFGSYPVDVECYNLVSRQTAHATQDIKDPITGLQLVSYGAKKANSFNIQWTIATGTDPNFNITFDGNLLSPTTYDPGTKMYTSGSVDADDTGVFEVLIFASNEVGVVVLRANFSVEVDVRDLQFNCTTDTVNVGDTVPFYVTMSQGTGVHLEWSYDDGSVDDVFEKPSGSPWPTSPSPWPWLQKDHIFLNDGQKTVRLVAWNGFSNISDTCQVAVINPVSNISIRTNSPITFKPPGYAEISFNQSMGLPPTDAWVTINFGDGSVTEEHPFEMGVTYTHVYSVDKVYTITATISNSASTEVVSTDVIVKEPVVDLALSANPRHASVGNPVEISATMYRGCGEGVNLHWDFGDDTTATTLESGSCPDGVSTVSHTYTRIQSQTITVVAENILGNTSATYFIYCQIPVTRDFTVVTGNPRVWAPAPSFMTQPFTLDSLSIPTDATVTWDFNDGTLVTEPLPGLPMNKVHQYFQPGHYDVTVTIENRASSEQFVVSVGLYEAITNPVVQLLYQPQLPTDSGLVPGHGINKDTFPTEREVVFNVTTSTGTVVWYILDATSGTHTDMCNYTSSPISHKFNVAENYNVKLTAWNSLGSQDVTTPVTLMNSNVDLKIRDGGIVTASSENKTFTLTFQSVGTDSCLVVDYGDGTSREAFGDPASCNPPLSDPTARYIGTFGSTTNIYHVYWKVGLYTITATAKNLISTAEDSLTFVVSYVPCRSPAVDIEDRAPVFYQPKQFLRSLIFRVIGTTDLNCTKTFDNTKRWRVWEVSRTTGMEIKEIDVTALVSYKKAELAVKAKFLKYGLYKIQYTVEMDPNQFASGEVFSGSADTYIEVTKSPLIGNMIEGGMTLITYQHGVGLDLSPSKYSFDPDLVEGEPQTFDSYTWFCMKIGDRGYPLLEDGSYNTSFVSEPLSDPTVIPTEDLGGCFREGPGRIGFDTGEISINTVQFDVNKTYEFMVQITKDTRTITAKLSVSITERQVPYVYIECKTKDLCERRPEGGQRINPSARLALTGKCLRGCSGPIFYEWEGFSYDYKWPYRPIPNFYNYTAGTGSPEIAINTQLFEDYPVESFRIKLSVWVEGGEKGVSQVDLYLNRPPRNGTCRMSPTGGTFLPNMMMNINCQDWIEDDDDHIETYQFFVTFKDEKIERHLVFGDEGNVMVQLPLGPDWDDHWMNVSVRISDSRGSYTTYFIDRARVPLTVSTDLKTYIDQLGSGENSAISLTAAKADLIESCYTFQSIGSAINMASKGSASEFQNMTVSAQQTPTGYGPGGVSKSHAVSLSTEQEEQAAKEKDERALLRAQMMEGIKDVTTSTVASVALKASTISVIGAYPDELNRQAQGDMMLILTDCANTLEVLSEDTSVEQIISAGANILEGVGKLLVAAKYHYKDPLLSDLALAKELDYYDTNRETEDIAIESLDPLAGRAELTFSTNQNEQTKTADDVVGKVVKGVKMVAAAVRDHLVAGENPVEIVTDQLALSVEKNRAGELANRTIDQGRGSVTLPDWCRLQPVDQNCSVSDIINLEVITTPSVPYGISKKAANLSFSSSIDISFVDENGNAIQIKDAPMDIEVNIPRDSAMGDVKALNAEPVILKREWEYLFYHRSTLENEDQAIHVQFRPNVTNVQYIVFIRFGDFPNVTEGKFDYVQTIPRKMSEAGRYGDDSSPDPYTFFIPNNMVPVGSTGDFYIGIRQLSEDEHDMYDSTFSNNTDISWAGGTDTFTSYYSMRVYTSSCLYYDEARKDWFSDGCRVGPLTSLKKTQCFCNHLTSFAGGLIVAPNTIDWDFVFANADFLKNPTLYVTEIVIFVLYLAAMVWARYKDKKDVEQVGIAPLADNDTRDKYYYEIVVQTGMRTNAGTDSKVHFIMSGEYEESDVRVLADSKRKILRRSNTDGFLMAVPRPLGPLNYVRIWHDNTGKGKFASWYLKFFLVRDLQTGEKFYFISNRWLAVEEGDGQVDRVIPVAGPEQILQFGHQFSQKTRRNLSDGHLWFSVVARPPRSRFTRVQRVSCCLCLLFLTMLANAMYYGTSTDATGANSFTIGPFALTPTQLYIGVVTNLIVFPISFLIITLFRKSRPRQKRPSRIQEAIRRNGVKLTDIRPEMGSRWSLRSDEQQLKMPDRNNPDMMDAPTPRPGTGVSTISNFRSETSMSGRISNSHYNADKKKRDKAKRKWTLPWWFQIVAWILLWAAIGVSVAFVTFYGISFGDYKCKQWITSMLIAFFTSVFVTQPIKVFLTAVILSLIIRNPGEDDEEGDEDEEDPHLGNDEEFLHKPLTSEDGYGAARPKKVAYKPPDPQALERARIVRLNEIKMWDVIREITFYGFFLWILMVISYGNRDPNAYLYKYSLERNFIGNNVSTSDLRNVHNTKNFWNWTTNSLIPSIRASVYYNDDPPIYLRGYINDKVSRIMGYATMRQVRIQKGTCRLDPMFQDLIESCNGDFSFWNEEKGTYGVSWEKLNDTSAATRSDYMYTDATKLNGYPYWGKLAMYSGGGYVVELRAKQADLKAKMEQLEAEEWIDKYTRAVFVEFTVYNPQVNLFAVSTLLAEWHPSAGVIAMYRFEPVRLLTYMSSAMLFQIICEVTFLLFILFFIFREIKQVIKLKFKYFLQFWNLMELNIIGLSISAIVIYFYRLIVTNKLTGIFKASHGNDYMKFQYVGYWNEVLLYLIGWLVFMSTIKFLKLLRFNRRMSLLASTLGNSWKSMFHFGIIFVLVFLSFIQFFYLVYHTAIFNFSSFVSTMEAGFLMMMGKFDIYSMTMLEPVLTPIFFFLFVITVTFILVNMFISILNESFSAVKRDITKQSNEHEIVDFMLGRFKQWTGMGGEPPPTAKPNEVLNNKLNDPYGKPSVDHFPDKVDELLNTISKAYFDQDNLENVLGPKTDADRMAMKNLLKQHAEASKRPLSAGRVNKVANFDPDSGQYRKY